MFVRIFLVILSLAALTAAAVLPGQDKSAEPACGRYVFPICTRDFNPVCGSDGKTYGNECMLCFDNRLHQLNTFIVKKGNVETHRRFAVLKCANCNYNSCPDYL